MVVLEFKSKSYRCYYLISILLIMSQHVSPGDPLHVKQNNFLRKDMSFIAYRSIHDKHIPIPKHPPKSIFM